jgi:hypothetical protein
MMVIADLFERASVQETADGVELTRVYHVEGLDGDAASRAARVLQVSGIPRIGEPHPLLAAATVVERSVTFLDPDNAEIAVTYRTPSAGTAAGAIQQAGGVAVLSVDFSATTFTERTSRDIDGRPMRNTYVVLNSVTAEAVEIDAFRPQLIVRIRHTRPALPKDLAKRFIGAVNADGWAGDAPETWLCTAFSTEREAGQVICTFEALYRAETWRVPHVMKINGLPVTQRRVERANQGSVEGEGVRWFTVYRAERFSDLGLTW